MAPIPNNSFLDQPTNNIIPSFSFSGCGFLGVYHVGVAACLKEHTDVVNRKEIKFAGASAGALVATTLLCDLELVKITKILLDVAKIVRCRAKVDLANLVREVPDENLPQDAHIKLSGRLHISVTLVAGLDTGLVTQFRSREHLIECLVATSFVPGFLGWIPPVLEGRDFQNLRDGPSTSVPDILSELPQKCSAGTSSESEMSESDMAHQRFVQAYRRKSISSSDQSCRRENLLDVWSDDNTEDTETRTSFSSTKSEPQEGYMKRFARLCYTSVRRTSSFMRKVPGASVLLDRMTPQLLDGLDEFIEALVLEVMSDNHAVFDGGFSDNLPTFDSNTITICPFAGESDICPRDLTGLDFNIDLGRTSMHWSEDNAYRLSKALNPMDPELLLRLCEEGYDECLRFLSRNDLHSCKAHLMTRAAIAPSACNVGHAHCNCRLCQTAELKIRTSLSCVDCAKAKKKALASYLPQDVKDEFSKAIRESANESSNGFGLDRLIQCLWWCAEHMFGGTMKMVDLAIDFYVWLMRFCDMLWSWTDFALLTVAQRTDRVARLVGSLRSSIARSCQMRARLSRVWRP